MNEYSKELCHWGIKLGAEREGHKYVARVEGKKPGSYIYFYDLDQYNRWKSGAKNAIKEGTQKLKNKANEINSNTRAAARNAISGLFNRLKASKTSITDAAMKYADTVKKASRDAVRKYSDTVKATGKDALKKASDSGQRALKSIADKGAEVAKKVGNEALKNPTIRSAVDLFNKVKDQAANSVKNALRSEKGVAIINAINTIAERKLIDIPEAKSEPEPEKKEQTEAGPSQRVVNYSDIYRNGKDKQAGENYVKTQKIMQYRKNEPNWIKEFRKIEPDKNGAWPSTKELASAVNPAYGNQRSGSVNCFHCTTAYDLRKRGYDVSAAAAESRFSDTTSLNKFYDIEQSRKSTFGKATENQQKTIDALLDIDKVLSGKKPVYSDDGITVDYDIHVNDSKLNGYKEAKDAGVVFCHGGTTDNKGGSISIVPSNAITKMAESSSGKTYEEALEEILLDKKKRGKAIGDELTKAVETYPNNSWGRVGIAWQKGGGHSFVWEKDVDGTVRFVDAQTNKEVDISEFGAKASLYDTVDLIRTDNLTMKSDVNQFANNRDKKKPETNKVAYTSVEDRAKGAK